MVYLSYKIATSKPIDDGINESQRLSPRTGMFLHLLMVKLGFRYSFVR